MTEPRSRGVKVVCVVLELVVITVLLFPAEGAGSSEGRTWSWNVLGWPLLPPTPSLLVWLAVVFVAAVGTWVVLSLLLMPRGSSTAERLGSPSQAG